VRGAIDGGRHNPGRKEHGKDRGHPGRIFLQKGVEMLDGF